MRLDNFEKALAKALKAVHAIKMFSWHRFPLVVFGITFLSSCVVISENPAGEEVLRSKGKGWGGTWVGTNEVYYIDARDSLKGEIEIFTVSGNKKSNYALKSATGKLRVGEDNI